MPDSIRAAQIVCITGVPMAGPYKQYPGFLAISVLWAVGAVRSKSAPFCHFPCACNSRINLRENPPITKRFHLGVGLLTRICRVAFRPETL